MERVKYIKCREMKAIDNDADAVRLLESIFDAIDAIRDRRKYTDRDSISQYICTIYDLDKERPDDFLDEMLLSGAICTKAVNGKISFLYVIRLTRGYSHE